MLQFKNISFGASSAVITSLAIIVGLAKTSSPQMNIIAALLIIALADNVSDSFGIHIHEESECDPAKEVTKTTLQNFFARLIITMVFILLIFALPLYIATLLSIVFGILIIVFLSYFIAKKQKVNPVASIFQHLIITTCVMVASFFLRELLSDLAYKFL